MDTALLFDFDGVFAPHVLPSKVDFGWKEKWELVYPKWDVWLKGSQ
jgi:hypothetical protein